MICGLSSEEIMILQRWARIVDLPVVPVESDAPFADILELRRQWFNAGGNFPVNEWDVQFVRPSSGGAVIAVGK